MAYDPATGELIVLGGALVANGGQVLADIWSWGTPNLSGANWSALSPAASPPARSAAAMAFDPASGQTLLNGGQGESGLLGDTWVYRPDTDTWSEAATSGLPPRQGASMAFDAGTGQLLLFGGQGTGGTPLADTWVWNAVNDSWSEVSTSGPPARTAASMAFDAGTGQMLLFGGSGSGGTRLADTWNWSGTTWSEVSTAGPTARSGAAMTYDAATAQMVLFGGDGASGALGDTWTWSAASHSWTQVATTGPAPRWAAASAFDPGTGQFLIFGGADAGGPFGDTWSWNGTTWSQLPVATSPPARAGGSAAYDPTVGQLVLFGGLATGTPLADSWALQPASPTSGVAPAITSAAAATFTVGVNDSFQVTTTGTPSATVTEVGPLPSGVTLNPSGVLSGTPAAGTQGSYPVTITAANGVSQPATQAFTLVVKLAVPAPTVTKLTASPNPAKAHSRVTYTATVSPTTGAGPVTGQVTITGCGVRSLQGGTASCTHKYKSAGTQSITAVFLGSGAFAGSTSKTLREHIKH